MTDTCEILYLILLRLVYIPDSFILIHIPKAGQTRSLSLSAQVSIENKQNKTRDGIVHTDKGKTKSTDAFSYKNG